MVGRAPDRFGFELGVVRGETDTRRDCADDLPIVDSFAKRTEVAGLNSSAYLEPEFDPGEVVINRGVQP